MRNLLIAVSFLFTFISSSYALTNNTALSVSNTTEMEEEDSTNFLAEDTNFVTNEAMQMADSVKSPKYRTLVAPSLLPQTHYRMKTPGYWIGKISDPDKVIMTAEQIRQFNRYLQRYYPVKDIVRISPTRTGRYLKRNIQASYNYMRSRRPFYYYGKEYSDDYYEKIKKNLDLEKIPVGQFSIRYGLITRFTDQRVFPDSNPLYDNPMENYFDRGQASALDIGTPVAILHTSEDKQWFFVQAPLTEGWVPASQVAYCSWEKLKDFLRYAPFVVAVSGKSDIFTDEKMSEYYDFVRMGARLPQSRKVPGRPVKVVVPIRGDNGWVRFKAMYMDSEQISYGYLEYTSRTIINQAFKLLHTPYGWAGTLGEQDCSRYLEEVFATVGITLPRYSYYQGRVGQIVVRFKKSHGKSQRSKLLSDYARPGKTLLRKDGHIMLYLGSENNRHYVIHDTWSYADANEDVHIMGGVVISDLSLNEESTNKSLLEQLLSANWIVYPW